MNFRGTNVLTIEYLCSVAATKQVAGAKEDTIGDSRTIHVGGLQAAVTYFARVVPYTFFRGEASNASSGQVVVGKCRGINADEIFW